MSSVHLQKYSVFIAVFISLLFLFPTSANAQVTNPQNGSIGVEGTVPGDAPKVGAVISFPRDGATITSLPVTVTGICPSGLLVKIFKNNVFAGSTQCVNGNFSVQIDLFNGRNELVARVYDDLDQAGPDSNVVVVNFPSSQFSTPNRLFLTSSFAKKGANPGEKLVWPITVSGGNGPYAVSVDWGDGKTPDVISREFPGTFDISHTYDSPGVYNIIIRATDKDGVVAFLQVVGVANGPLTQSGSGTGQDGGGGDSPAIVKILWQPVALTIPLLFSTFWLGKRYELYVLRKRLSQGEDIR
jgi:hypothetical protein